MTNSSATPLFDLTPPSEAQLRKLIDGLSDEERRVMLHHGDEEPFCGVFLAEKREGVFTCRLCGLPLFKAGTKFESGTGWPSFTAPFDEDHLRRVRDARYATETFEVVCARCGAQQGHVFDDARRRAGCVTASTPSRFASRRRASGCPTSCPEVRPKAKCGTAEPARRSCCAVRVLCRVDFTDLEGIRHSVDVEADQRL